MSQEIKDLKKIVMDQIHNNKIKMKPKFYFILGSIFLFLGLVSSVVFSIFSLGLIGFALRARGPMAGYRFEYILSNFPWWAVLMAILGLIIGFYLIRKYEFSFKVNFRIIILGFVVAILAGAWLFDVLGFNDMLIRKGPMRGLMKNYIYENDSSRIDNQKNFNRNKINY